MLKNNLQYSDMIMPVTFFRPETEATMPGLGFKDLLINVELSTELTKKVEIVKFTGKITNENSYEINRKIHRVFDNNIYNIILNLDELEYINSTGVAILFSLFFRVRDNNGKIIIGGLHSFLRNVFSLMDLPEGLELYDSLEEAIDAF